MNREHRNRLIRCRQMLVDDLEVNLIMDFLIQNRVFDAECKQLIYSEKTSNDQVRRLLDLLPTRGPKAFNIFVKSLMDEYEWIAEELERDDSDKDDTDSTNTNVNETLLQTILLRGGVPHEPAHNIVRKDALKRLKEGLSSLAPGKFLVIHGMPGSGKSVLAADAIRDPEITLTYFPDGVFWFKVGMIEKDKLLNRMRILCEKLEANSVPTSIEHAQEILRKLFVSDRYSSSLLILDDVWSPDIVQSFNVSGRILVTTQDVSIMDVIGGQMQIIQINNGFTQEESLELFSSYVKIPINFLPDEAVQIHQECKGSPMVISMIGSLISETGGNGSEIKQRQSGRWAYYLQNLKSRRFSKIKKQRSYQYDSVMEAIKMSIDNLSPKLKRRYQELAVFLDDVGIPTKVLTTYWDMNAFEVEDIMTEFLKKSLAQSEFDPILNSYVYSLHDLQLDFLKNQLREDHNKEKELHRLFLDQYFRKYNFQYGEIEDDSYIFYNFGYHLFKSEQFQLFKDIYLDLSFVEAMLKANGPVDLLNDYKKYDELIMGVNEEHIDALEDFEAFTRKIGAIVTNSCYSDIIQLALREPEESKVYLAAKGLALQRPEKLYLEWSNRSQVRGQHTATILHHGVVEAACFLSVMTKILTSNGDGQIKVWDVQSGEVLHRFTGHKANVRSLALSPDGDIFASASDDGAVKIWDLGTFLGDEDVNGLEEQRDVLRKASFVKSRGNSFKRVNNNPTVRSFLTSDHELRDLSNKSFVFNELNHENALCVEFSPDGEEIVVSGNSGKVKVFNLRARCLRIELQGHKEAVNVCRFSPDGDYIATGSDDATIRLWDAETGEFCASNNVHATRILDLAFVYTPDSNNNKIISMSAEKLILWSSPVNNSANFASYQTRSVSNNKIDNNKKSLSMEVVEFKRTREAFFTCMSLSKRCQKLAAGTVDNMITVWDVGSTQVLSSLPGHSSYVYSLDFTHDDSFLMSGSADETVMFWSMEEEYSSSSPQCAPCLPDNYKRNNQEMTKNSSLNLGPCFDAKFFDDGSCRIVAPDDTNCIQVLHNGVTAFKAPADFFRITAVAISADGETVSYGCENGSVRLFRPSKGLVKHMGMHRGRVNDVKINKDGLKVVSAGDDKIVRIFHDGEKIFNCRGSTGPVKEVHFFAEESLLISRCEDGSIRTWNISDGLQLRYHEPPEENSDHVTSVDGNPKSNMLAVAKVSGTVSLFKLDTLEFVRDLTNTNSKVTDEKRKRNPDPVRVCRFSDDGRFLAVGYDAGIVEVWDVKSGTRFSGPLCLHQSWVNDIQFSSCGNFLVTVGDKIAFWKIGIKSENSRTSLVSLNSSSSGNLSPLLRKSSQGSNTKTSRPFGRRRKGSASDVLTSAIESSSDLESGTLTPGGSSKRLSRLGQDENNLLGSGPFIAKVGKLDNRELLQIFDPRGSSMAKIFASKDFRKFVTLDDAGLLYMLEEILPPQLLEDEKF